MDFSLDFQLDRASLRIAVAENDEAAVTRLLKKYENHISLSVLIDEYFHSLALANTPVDKAVSYIDEYVADKETARQYKMLYRVRYDIYMTEDEALECFEYLAGHAVGELRKQALILYLQKALMLNRIDLIRHCRDLLQSESEEV